MHRRRSHSKLIEELKKGSRTRLKGLIGAVTLENIDSLTQHAKHMVDACRAQYLELEASQDQAISSLSRAHIDQARKALEQARQRRPKTMFGFRESPNMTAEEIALANKLAEAEARFTNDRVRIFEKYGSAINDKKLEFYAWLSAPDFLAEERLRLESRKKTEDTRAKVAAFNGRARDPASAIRKRQLKGWNGECAYCRSRTDSEDSHQDHIYPVRLGGMATTQNLVMVCKSCNQKKRDRTLLEFCEMERLDFVSVARHLRSLGKKV